MSRLERSRRRAIAALTAYINYCDENESMWNAMVGPVPAIAEQWTKDARSALQLIINHGDKPNG